MTQTEIMKLVAMLVATYRNTMRLDDRELVTMSAVYETMLADLDAEAATCAVKRLIASSKWMPTIAEIRSAVLEITEGPVRAAGDAWGDVREAIGTVGMNRYPRFADPVVARCVDALGWTELCLSENAVADRARFIELYAQLATSERRERVVAGIPGASAKQLIGDVQCALTSGTVH